MKKENEQHIDYDAIDIAVAVVVAAVDNGREL